MIIVAWAKFPGENKSGLEDRVGWYRKIQSGTDFWISARFFDYMAICRYVHLDRKYTKINNFLFGYDLSNVATQLFRV